MELKQLQYFEAICKYHSISRAAQDLYMTQQGVSRQIQQLEAELNTTLFERSSQGVVLTEDGRYFYEQAAIILQTQHDIEEYFSDRGRKKRLQLRVGISHGLSLFFNAKFLEVFSSLHPDSHFLSSALWSPQIEDSVLDRSIDIGFTVLPLRHPELKHTLIMREPLYIIVNDENPLAERSSVCVEDLFDYKIAMADENYNTCKGFEDLCEQKGVHPEMHKMFDLLSIYHFVLLNRDAVGFTLKSYEKLLRFDHLRYIPLNHSGAFWDICLVWNAGSKKQLLQDFVDYSLRYCSDGPPVF